MNGDDVVKEGRADEIGAKWCDGCKVALNPEDQAYEFQALYYCEGCFNS